jgi:hypothetical protein
MRLEVEFPQGEVLAGDAIGVKKSAIGRRRCQIVVALTFKEADYPASSG